MKLTYRRNVFLKITYFTSVSIIKCNGSEHQNENSFLTMLFSFLGMFLRAATAVLEVWLCRGARALRSRSVHALSVHALSEHALSEHALSVHPLSVDSSLRPYGAGRAFQ